MDYDGVLTKIDDNLNQTGGVSEGRQKPNPLIANVFFLVSVQNNSRTPKNMFYTWSGVPMSYLQPLGQL